jgi:hypothetical protein
VSVASCRFVVNLPIDADNAASAAIRAVSSAVTAAILAASSASTSAIRAAISANAVAKDALNAASAANARVLVQRSKCLFANLAAISAAN